MRLETAEGELLEGIPPCDGDQVLRHKILKLAMSFKEITQDLLSLVPESPARELAFRKLLEARTAAAQALTNKESPNVINKKRQEKK